MTQVLFLAMLVKSCSHLWTPDYYLLSIAYKLKHILLKFTYWTLTPNVTVSEERGSLGSTAAAAAAKSLQSSPTLCYPIDGSSPGSPVPGILQARTLEWVAISFSNAWKWKVKVKSFSRVRHLATPWTAAYQAPPSMGFSRQEYWSGVPLPSLRTKSYKYITLITSHITSIWLS